MYNMIVIDKVMLRLFTKFTEKPRGVHYIASTYMTVLIGSATFCFNAEVIFYSVFRLIKAHNLELAAEV